MASIAPEGFLEEFSELLGLPSRYEAERLAGHALSTLFRRLPPADARAISRSLPRRAALTHAVPPAAVASLRSAIPAAALLLDRHDRARCVLCAPLPSPDSVEPWKG